MTISVGCDRVVVVLVNYFSERYLAESLTALRGQTRPPERTILVDNGGSPTARDAVLRDFPEVELLVMPNNVGFAAANNRAVESAVDSDWIALLNVDAFPEPTWLAELLAATRNHPDCDFFGSKLVNACHGELLDGTGDVYHTSGRPWRRNHGEPQKSELRTTQGTLAPCAAAAIYRRASWAAVGGLDEGFFCYLEDIDLALRLHLAGFKYRHVPEAIVRHVGSAVTGRRSEFSDYHGHRNLVWTYFKNMPGSLFWLYLPQHLLLNVVSLLWLAFQGRGKTVLRAKLDALGGIPRVWRQRRRIQRARRISTRDFDALLSHGWRRLLQGT